jgi:hypothetical protein
MRELMLRLVRNGKIVGYEWHYGGEILHGISLVNQFWTSISSMPGCYIRHDYPDLGVKVGDEWWFSHDYFKLITDEETVVVELYYEGINWYIKAVDNGETSYLNLRHMDNMTRIGTIYDEVKP